MSVLRTSAPKLLAHVSPDAPAELIAIQPLDQTSAVALASALAGAPKGDAEALACSRVVGEELAGLSVAVEVAAKAVKEWAGGWAAYEGYLAEQTAFALDDARDRSEHYPRGVFAALDLAIDRCLPGSPERALLEGMAVFAPDAVPIAWPYAAALLDADTIVGRRALAALEGLGIVQLDREAATLSIHRLMHKRVEQKIVPDIQLRVSHRASVCVAEWMAKAVGRTRSQMEDIEARRAHIERALQAAERVEGDRRLSSAIEKLGKDGRVWIRIANPLAQHLRYRGQYEESRALSERSLEKNLTHAAPDLEEMAVSLSAMAFALQATGEAKRASLLLEHALAIVEMIHGPDHPDVAMGRSNLARVLPDVGAAERALSLLEHALTITEKTYGPDHPSVATSLSNLAGVLEHLSEPDKARPLLERALAIAEKTHGASHPSVAAILSNLAMVLRDLGDAGRARPLLERALAIDETVYGKSHPDVARRLSKLAGVLRDLGEAGGARPLLARALAIDEKTYGPRHPTVAKSLTRLISVLRDLGEVDEARALFERAGMIDGGTSGPGSLRQDTRATLLTLQSLGVVKAKLGRKQVLERSLAIAEEIYGEDHRIVAAILSNLAVGIMPSKPDKARPLLERELAILERADRDAPAVAICLLNLAHVRHRLGEPDKALPLLERSLAIFEENHGPTHWDVALVLTGLGLTLKDLGKPRVALPFLERSLAINEELYGPDDGVVAWSLSNLALVLQAMEETAEAEALLKRAADIRKRG